MDTVALVRFNEDIEESVQEGLKLVGGFGTLQSPVLIKPNICTISDKTGSSVTDVRMIEALITLIFKEDPNLSVRIVESDSQSKWATEAFDKFGYTALAKMYQKQDFDVSCVNLSSCHTKKIHFKGLYFTNPILPDGCHHRQGIPDPRGIFFPPDEPFP